MFSCEEGMEWHLGWFGLNLPAEVSRDIDSGQPNLVFDRRQKRFNRGRQAGFPRLFLQFHAVMTLGCTSRFGFDRTYGMREIAEKLNGMKMVV